MKPRSPQARLENTVQDSIQRRAIVVSKLARLEGFVLGVLAIEPNHERAALAVLAMLDKAGGAT
jgi:hypothetical protein